MVDIDEVHLECFHSECRNVFRARCHLPDAGSSVGTLVRIINDSFSRLKRDMGTDIELCQSSLPKKKGASVSVPLWLICQTLLQRSQSHVTQLRRICREFSALISRRLPRSLKEQRHKQPPRRLPPSYLAPSYHDFHDSSLHHLSRIVKISHPDLFQPLAPSPLFSSFCSSRTSINIKMSWETSLSLTQTAFGVSRTRRSLEKKGKKHRFVIPVALLREFFLDCLFLTRFTFSHSGKFVTGVKPVFFNINYSKWWNKRHSIVCLSEKWFEFDGVLKD